MHFKFPAAPLTLLTLLALTGCIERSPTVDPDLTEDAEPTRAPDVRECEFGEDRPCGPNDTGNQLCDADGRWGACFGEDWTDYRDQGVPPEDSGVALTLTPPADFILPQAPLPFRLHHGVAVASTPQAVYAIGGAQAPDQRFRAEVYRAAIQPDGHLAEWAPARPLPEPVNSAAAAVVGEHLVVLINRERDPNQPIGAADNARIYVAPIDADGDLGSWVDVAEEGPPPGPVTDAALFVDGRRLYVVGGSDHCVANALVRSAELDEDGWFGPWREEPALLGARFRSAALIHAGAAWVLGGHPGCSQYHRDLLRAELGEAGLGDWQVVGELGRDGAPAAVGATDVGIFFIGGDGGGYPVGDVGMVRPEAPVERFTAPAVAPFTGASTQQGPFVYTVGAQGVFRIALPGCADGRCVWDFGFSRRNGE